MNLRRRGRVQLFSRDPFLAKITPWRERKALANAIPAITERAPSFHAYGRASIQGILADKAATARELGASTFESMVFLNRGDHFEAHPLPAAAQFAPAFGVSVADFDGDVRMDLAVAQHKGETRLFHNTGYWSQDSTTLVLAAPTAPTALRARWSGGKNQVWPWPGNARCIIVAPEGVILR